MQCHSRTQMPPGRNNTFPSSQMPANACCRGRIRMYSESRLVYALPFWPTTSLRFFTALARRSSTWTVSSQPMQASVMLTPYLRASLPSLGTFCAPARMLERNEENGRAGTCRTHPR